MTRRTKAAPPTPPKPLMSEALHQRIDSMGLTIMSYQHWSTKTPGGRRWWIPRNIMGSDGALILWKVAGAENNQYGFDGWDCQLVPFTHGGMRPTLGQTLGWIDIARGVRDGVYRDFYGRLAKTS